MSRAAPLAALDENQRYTIEESIRYLRTSRKTIYSDINANPPRLKTFKEGRRRYVPGSELKRRSMPPANEAAIA
jgi:hypothetical protein